MKIGKRRVCDLKSMSNSASLCLLLLVALLLYHDPFLLLWWPQKPAEKPKTVSLDMATDSVDDMYDGCRAETASVIDLFGVYEWHANKNFSIAWASAERRANKPLHKNLTDDHAKVLYLYTKEKKIQQAFNKAVKTGKYNYSTSGFKFHYFYFFLTDAVQVLRQNLMSCRTTYHRTRTQFDRDVINKNMRFGAFTWAALDKQSFEFNGNASCFEIHSCFGADITHYSATHQTGQVLIPPYEVFTVTAVLTNDPWCSVVYKLHSTKKPRTDSNCKLVQRQIRSYFAMFLTHYPTGSVGMMLTWLMLLIIISLVLIKRRQKYFVAGVLGALLVLVIVLVMLKISH